MVRGLNYIFKNAVPAGYCEIREILTFEVITQKLKEIEPFESPILT